jgi:hypothetical protein
MEKIVDFCKKYAYQYISIYFKKEDILYPEYGSPIKNIGIVVYRDRELYKVDIRDSYRFFSETKNLQYIKYREELSIFWKKLLSVLTPEKIETNKYCWDGIIKRSAAENLMTYEMKCENKRSGANLIKVLSVKRSNGKFKKIDYDERRVLFDSNLQVLPHFNLIFNTYCLYFECPEHCRKAIYFFLLMNKKKLFIHKDATILIAKMIFKTKNDECWLRLCKWNSKTRESLTI